MSPDTLQKEPETEVVHMWTPYDVKVDEHYDFVPDGPVFAAVSRGLVRLVVTVFPLINRICFGLETVGKEKLEALSGGAVTVCNHVHILDCTMAACCAPRRKMYFPTLKTNFDIPVIRFLVRVLGGIPIPRGNRGLARFSAVIRELLRKGNLVHFYPEGILDPYYGPIRSFRRGAFAYAYDSGVPVVPMVITYREPVGRAARFFHRKPLLRMTVLEPVYPRLTGDRQKDVDWLKKTCSEAMTRKFLEETERKD